MIKVFFWIDSGGWAVQFLLMKSLIMYFCVSHSKLLIRSVYAVSLCLRMWFETRVWFLFYSVLKGCACHSFVKNTYKRTTWAIPKFLLSCLQFRAFQNAHLLEFSISNLEFLLYNWNYHVWLMNLFTELGVKFVLTQLENS